RSSTRDTRSPTSKSRSRNGSKTRIQASTRPRLRTRLWVGVLIAASVYGPWAFERRMASGIAATLARGVSRGGYHWGMEGSGFGGLFGDHDALQSRLGEFAEQLLGAQELTRFDHTVMMLLTLYVRVLRT